MRRAVLFTGLGLLAFLLGLVAQLPADRAATWFAPEGVELQGVRGTAWAGHAVRVEHGGTVPITSLDWDLAAWRLLGGAAVADVELEWAGLAGSGTLERGLGGGLRLRDARVRGPMSGVGRALPGTGLRLAGKLVGRVERAAIADGRIEQLAARAEWSEAAVVAPLSLDLGRVRVEIAAAEGRPGRRIDISGEGGALAIEGAVDLEPDGRYRADIRLEPTGTAPSGLRETLAMFAQRDGDGYRIRRSGRLPALGGG